MLLFRVDFTKSAEEQYLDLLRNIIVCGDDKGDRTGTGTRDLFGYQLRIDLQKGFPLLTTKKMFHRGMVEELLWMMRGDTNVKTLQSKGVKIWDEWATKEQCARFGREEGDLGPVYGHLFRNFGGTPKADGTGYHLDGVDQLQTVLTQLRTNPFSRRIIVSGWSPKDVEQVALPPCHTLFQFSCRDNQEGNRFLDCQLYQRSADALLGIPFNIAGYALLTHIMAGLSDMRPGTFIHTFGSAHIYNNHRAQVEEQLSRTPYPLCTLSIEAPMNKDMLLDSFLAFCKGDEDFKFVDYQSHPPIKAEVSV